MEITNFVTSRELVVNYRSLTIQHDAIEGALNSLAAEGWELVSIFDRYQWSRETSFMVIVRRLEEKS